jgi:hypothetical protein
MALNRDEILGMIDLTTKEITIPGSIPVWGDKKLYIKQLTRGDQDNYLIRQFGTGKVKPTGTEYDMVGLYGHDAWLCSRGISDAEGKRIFSESDVEKLAEKSGEFIGYVALEILKFSGMDLDSKIAKKAAKAQVKEELKN